MRLHASLLIAASYALLTPFIPAEPQFNRYQPNIGLFTAANVALTCTSGAVPANITSYPAMLVPVAVTTLRAPGAHAVRTTASLTVPAGADWQTVIANESLVLVLESGDLHVRMDDGLARIARDIETNPGGPRLEEIALGQEADMRAGDRLVAHGDGALSVHSDDECATVTIIRVGMPETP